jgi:hypothetical protein
MRTVLIGSDFMYDKDGNLKPIEINTNANLSQNSLDTTNTFDLIELSNFIDSNSFTKITYIGRIMQFNYKLKVLCESKSLEYNFLITNESAVTVPYVEDADNHLIIRSAYDTTALIDETYCKDKIEFMELISESSFGSQFAFKNINGEIINTITDIVDNGNHPNFLLKSTQPAYNQAEFPKLLKIIELNQILDILNTLPTGVYILPFYFNENKLYNNHIQVLRSFDILYLPNLQAISVGATRKFCLNNITSEESEFTGVYLNDAFRTKYLTDVASFEGPKVLATDKLIMSNGSTKLASEIVKGDMIKSITIESLPSDSFQTDLTTWTGSYSNLLNNSTFVDTEILSIKEISKLTYTSTITFTDNTTWSDAANSTILVKEEGDTITFRSLASLLPGMDIIFYDLLDGQIDTPSNTILKTVQSVENNSEWFNGYEIDVLGTDVFFTINNDNTNHLNLSSVSHNCPKHSCHPYYQTYTCFVCNIR